MLKIVLIITLVAVGISAFSIKEWQNPQKSENSKDSSSQLLHDIEPYLVELGNNTYYFEHNIRTYWIEAKQFCRSNGMFLVSVENPAENELIKKHILQYGNGNYWTSGNDIAVKYAYVWDSTGKSITFSDWHAGQPNHATGSDGTDRVIVYENKENGNLHWNDYPEGYWIFHFICKKL